MSEITISANNGPGTYTIIGTATTPTGIINNEIFITVARTAVRKSPVITTGGGGGGDGSGGVGDGQTESIAQQFLA